MQFISVQNTCMYLCPIAAGSCLLCKSVCYITLFDDAYMFVCVCVCTAQAQTSSHIGPGSSYSAEAEDVR